MRDFIDYRITMEVSRLSWTQQDIDRYLLEKYGRDKFANSTKLDSELSTHELGEFYNELLDRKSQDDS